MDYSRVGSPGNIIYDLSSHWFEGLPATPIPVECLILDLVYKYEHDFLNMVRWIRSGCVFAPDRLVINVEQGRRSLDTDKLVAAVSTVNFCPVPWELEVWPFAGPWEEFYCDDAAERVSERVWISRAEPPLV